MTAVHLLAYAASKFVASRAERKAKEIERAQSQKISTIGTYGDSPEFVVFDPAIHDPNLFNAKQTAVGLGTGNQSISNLPTPDPVDPQDKFHTAYIHPDIPSVEPMTLRGWQSWAQTNTDGPFQTMDSQDGSDFDFMQEFNAALRPVGQLNEKDGSFTPKEMGVKKETTSLTRKPVKEVAGFYIRGGGFFKTEKEAEAELKKMRDAGGVGPETKIEKTTRIEYDDGTFSFETFSDIADAAAAANNAKKGTPLFSLAFNPITKGGESETPDPIQIYAETGVDDERMLSQISTQVGERFAGLNRNQILAQVNTDSYRTFIRNLATTVVSAATKPMTRDGVVVQSMDLVLQEDPREYLRGKYKTLSNLPGMFEALEQATFDMPHKDLNLTIQENVAKNETTIVTKQSTDDGNIAHLATGVSNKDLNGSTDGVADYSGTGTLDQLGQRLLSMGVDKNNVDIFIQEGVVNFERVDGKLVRSKDQPRVRFIDYLFNTKVGGTGRLYYDVLQGVFAKRDSTTYTDVETEVLRQFMEDYGDIDDKVMFMTNTSNQFNGKGAPRRAFKLQTVLKADSFAELQNDNKARNQAFKNAVTFLKGSVQSYRTSDGELIPFGAVAGQLVLTVDGILHFGGQILTPLLESIIPDAMRGSTPFTAEADNLVNTIRASALGENKIFTSFLDLSVEQQRKEAARRGVDFETFRQQQITAKAELEKQFNTLVTEPAKGGNEQSFRLAMRGYYRFMAAYAMASAMQGGTGGRTISDQDVLNFLKAFNQGNFFSDPATEEAVLKAILVQMEQQEYLTRKLSQGGPEAAAIFAIQNYPEGDEAFNFTLNELAARVGVDMDKSEDTGDGQAGAAPKITNENIYQRLLENFRETTPSGFNMDDFTNDEVPLEQRLKGIQDMYPGMYDDALEELNAEIGEAA
jgi:hypothetical protein